MFHYIVLFSSSHLPICIISPPLWHPAWTAHVLLAHAIVHTEHCLLLVAWRPAWPGTTYRSIHSIHLPSLKSYGRRTKAQFYNRQQSETRELPDERASLTMFTRAWRSVTRAESHSYNTSLSIRPAECHEIGEKCLWSTNWHQRTIQFFKQLFTCL